LRVTAKERSDGSNLPANGYQIAALPLAMTRTRDCGATARNDRES